MSQTYTLTCHIDQVWIKQWQGKKNLCFATGVSGGSDPVFNVIAASEETLSASISFSWQETYKIAASSQKVQNGVSVAAQTTPEVIQYNQGYFLKPDWTDSTPQFDTSAPQNGFNFHIPRGLLASSVVYKTVQGNSRPVYISPDGPLPEGVENLIPVMEARVWFQGGTKNGQMIEEYVSTPFQIDFTNNPQQSCTFNEQGEWSLDQ